MPQPELTQEQKLVQRVLQAFVQNTFEAAVDAFAKSPNSGIAWIELKRAMYLYQAWQNVRVSVEGPSYYNWLDSLYAVKVADMAEVIFERAHGKDWQKEVVTDR